MNAEIPCLGFASDCLKICFNQSEALPRSGWWRVISMEFLYSFLRRHFAGKPVDFQKSPSSDFIWRGTSSFAAKKCSSLSPRGRLVASLGNRWHRKMLVVLSGYQNKGVLKELDNVFFPNQCSRSTLRFFVWQGSKVLRWLSKRWTNVCYKVTHDRGCSSSCSSFW